MKAWRAAITVAAVLSVGTAWATDDNAKARGGGGSSSVGARHHSGSSGSSDSSSSSSGSSSSSSSSSSSKSSYEGNKSSGSSSPTAAQLRHPRAGTGTGWRDHRGGRYRYYGYDPYWYGYGFYGYNWYAPFYYGGYYGNYDDYAPYPHRYGYSSYRSGSVRVLVQPNDTRVYVDGYYAGIADDFDGLFQRLHVSPGRHDVSLRLDGYRTHNVKLYVPYDGTIKLHHKMNRGAGEENAGIVGRPDELARIEERERDYETGDLDDRDRRYDQRGERGLVRLDVRPGDASVYVDGAFRGTGRDLRQLRLTPGRHRIEVVRPGYRTMDREVDVRQGQTVDLDFDLERG